MSKVQKYEMTEMLTVALFNLKSLYISCAGSHFYGTEHEIWADFGPVGNTEKKIGGRS